MPYLGTLKRGEDALEAFLKCLGQIWASYRSGRSLIAFEKIYRVLNVQSEVRPNFLKDLPTYAWDHNDLICHESRASRHFRSQSQPQHELLGHQTTFGENGGCGVHWRQIFKLNELPWAKGHIIQGEILFPATGYLTMAYEAAIHLAGSQVSVRLVELHAVEIVRAMGLQEGSPGLEVVFTVSTTS